MGDFPKVLNFDNLFLKLNRFICSYIDFPNLWGRANSACGTLVKVLLTLVPPKDLETIVHLNTNHSNTVHKKYHHYSSWHYPLNILSIAALFTESINTTLFIRTLSTHKHAFAKQQQQKNLSLYKHLRTTPHKISWKCIEPEHGFMTLVSSLSEKFNPHNCFCKRVRVVSGISTKPTNWDN